MVAWLEKKSKRKNLKWQIWIQGWKVKKIEFCHQIMKGKDSVHSQGGKLVLLVISNFPCWLASWAAQSSPLCIMKQTKTTMDLLWASKIGSLGTVRKISIGHHYELTFFGLVTNIDVLCTYEPPLSQCVLLICCAHVSWCVIQHVDWVSSVRRLICQPVWWTGITFVNQHNY